MNNKDYDLNQYIIAKEIYKEYKIDVRNEKYQKYFDKYSDDKMIFCALTLLDMQKLTSKDIYEMTECNYNENGIEKFVYRIFDEWFVLLEIVDLNDENTKYFSINESDEIYIFMRENNSDILNKRIEYLYNKLLVSEKYDFCSCSDIKYLVYTHLYCQENKKRFPLIKMGKFRNREVMNVLYGNSIEKIDAVIKFVIEMCINQMKENKNDVESCTLLLKFILDAYEKNKEKVRELKKTME